MRLTRRDVLAGGISTAALSLLPGCDRSEIGSGDSAMGPFDVCVIGSGFAGTHLALELVASGYRTAIVEAGSELPSDTQASFPVENAGKIRYPATATRAIALGGTSTHWTGMVNRLRPSDFRLSTTFGMEVDWPLTYQDLEPYYCRAETALSTEGRAMVEGAEPARSCDYPQLLTGAYVPPHMMNQGRLLPFFAVAQSRRKGQPVRLVDEELPMLKRAPSAEVFSDHRVMRLFSRETGFISHAEVQTPNGTRKTLRARCFVIAAGVIESPRLLLMSTSERFPRGLGNSNDLVGRNFVEHPTLMFRFRSNQLPAIGEEAAHRTYAFNDLARRKGMNAYHYQLNHWKSGKVIWKMQPEMQPMLENRITLSTQNRDAFDAPIPRLSFSYSERDLKTNAHAEKFLRAQAIVMDTSANEFSLSERWRAHPSGTCRMGFNDRSGVVDRDNRVFGTSNLYVSGACVFPTSGTANPTLTVVAMTLRLGDHLKSVLRG
jgi:choline dehydrogenase-like flavoprotein